MSLSKVAPLSPEDLAEQLQHHSRSLVIVDCRSGIEYSTWHISGAVNIGGSRASRRDILSGRVTVLSVLHDNVPRPYSQDHLMVVYDQCSVDSGSLQSLAGRVAEELSISFKRVCFLKGGFIGFQSKFADLCWTNKHKLPDEDFVAPSQSVASTQHTHDSGYLSLTRSQTMSTLISSQPYVVPSLTSCLLTQDTHSLNSSLLTRHALSGPALPVSKEGPTTLLPHLFLGTQQDALSHSSMLKHAITHVVNVSVDGVMSPLVSPHNFLRIPVSDNFADKITPYFAKAFKFLDDVKSLGGRALVHCSAGISRSPTLAIGYLMRTMNISVTEAYNIVKASRVSVSPNFNFMGQLTDYEKLLKSMSEERIQSSSKVAASTTNKMASIRQKRRPSRLSVLSSLFKVRSSTSPTHDGDRKTPCLNIQKISAPLLPSPSVPFARLGINSPMDECPGIRLENFPATSLDQLHFQPCQTGLRGIKTKRCATTVHHDSSNIRKRLSIMESSVVDVVYTRPSVIVNATNSGLLHTDSSSVRRHSSVFPLTLESSAEASVTLLQNEGTEDKSLCLPGRSVSYEKINCPDSSTWNSSSIITDSCRLQECYHSTSSLSSANSHSSNLLV